MGKTIDAAIGWIETAESLDRPGYALGGAISRTGQVGEPAEQDARQRAARPLLWPSGAPKLAGKVDAFFWVCAAGVARNGRAIDI